MLLLQITLWWCFANKTWTFKRRFLLLLSSSPLPFSPTPSLPLPLSLVPYLFPCPFTPSLPFQSYLTPLFLPSPVILSPHSLSPFSFPALLSLLFSMPIPPFPCPLPCRLAPCTLPSTLTPLSLVPFTFSLTLSRLSSSLPEGTFLVQL